ncbi:MAG: general secretion pathway protein GspK [Candidatus Omnitrophica bacterium]|nr:general secretion pathway protein GspK [Candidatus Omnitrophota bacterium]
MNCRGSVLIVALWATIFFGMMSIALSVRARSQAHLLMRLAQDRIGRQAAFGGISFARAAFAQKAEEEEADSNDEPAIMVTDSTGDETAWDWSSLDQNHPELFRNFAPDDSETYLSIGYWSEGSGEDGPRWIYGMENEERRININAVDEEVLKALYLNAGRLLEDQAVELAEATIAWREREDTPDGMDLEAPSGGWGFGSVEELLRVPGMTTEIYDVIKEDLTVYGSGKTNLNAVRAATLGRLGISVSIASGVESYRESFFESEGSEDEAAGPFGSLSDLAEKAGLTEEDAAVFEGLKQFWGFEPETFRFFSIASGRRGQNAGFECVMDRAGRVLFLREATIGSIGNTGDSGAVSAG